MTNPTPHGQVPEALIDLIDEYAETRHRCGGIYNARTEAARNAVIEALSEVQALSSAPADVEDAIAWLVTWKGGEHTYVHAHASELPAVTQARVMGGTVTPCVAALAASPTPPVEQQAAPKAAPGEQNTVPAEWLEQAYREGWAACRDAETIGEEAEDWAFGNSTANSRMIDAQQAAPKQEAQEPVAWQGVHDQTDLYYTKPLQADVRPLYAAPQQEAQDATVAAFEAVRKKLCTLPRYSFVLDDDGLVRRAPDRTGNWIEFDEAHALFDPVSVEAALAAQGGK